MKKYLALGMVGALSLSIFASGGTASAESVEDQLTENFTINWDEIWENTNTDDLKEEVEFGTNSLSRSMDSLAIAKTALSLESDGYVLSTGTTKGRILTTTTSATTSIRDVANSFQKDGGKRMAVGTFTATSTARMGNTPGVVSPYTGLTLHTATDNGKLYQTSTGRTIAY